MPRLNSGLELFRKLDTLQVFRQAGSTQTTAAAAIGSSAGTVNFTATTGFTAADAIAIVGSGGAELNAITAVTPTTAVPLMFPALVTNPSGSVIYRMTSTSLAHITEEGIRLGGTAPLTAINSALAGAPIGYIYGYGELQASMSLLGMNGLNLQAMFGITEAEIGAGSSASPHGVAVLGGNIGSQAFQCVRATGTRVDGTILIFDFNDVKIEPQGEISLTRNAAASLPINLRFTSLCYRQYI
jgi:hypothetical protein